jgi:hypothetical protein
MLAVGAAKADRAATSSDTADAPADVTGARALVTAILAVGAAKAES